jgi:hypothetical protein
MKCFFLTVIYSISRFFTITLSCFATLRSCLLSSTHTTVSVSLTLSTSILVTQPSYHQRLLAINAVTRYSGLILSFSPIPQVTTFTVRFLQWIDPVYSCKSTFLPSVFGPLFLVTQSHLPYLSSCSQVSYCLIPVIRCFNFYSSLNSKPLYPFISALLLTTCSPP